MKFNVGDLVRVHYAEDGTYYQEEAVYFNGKEGKILKINKGNTYPYVVDIPDPGKDGFKDSIWREEELELV